MVRGCCNDGVAWQVVDLHQQRCDDTLNLARLMNVAALLADGVELIEKQYARFRSRIVEYSFEPILAVSPR